MKKYKLKKWYPSLPEWWEEGEVYCFSSNAELDKVPNTFYKELEDVNFWEEINEKSYEILSLKAHTFIYNEPDKDGDKFWRNNGDSYILFKLNLKNIHSIKRLSDNVVFTVGDRLHKYDANIISFEIKNKRLEVISDAKGKGLSTDRVLWKLKDIQQGKEEKLCVPVGTKFKHIACYEHLYTIDSVCDSMVTIVWLQNNTTQYTISKANDCFERGLWKISKPLLTTEDGVEIFEGDDVFLVHSSSYNPKKTRARKELLPVQCYQKYYSTEEKAKDYVIENKPCLSYKDVVEWGVHPSIKEMIKRKLKNKW